MTVMGWWWKYGNPPKSPFANSIERIFGRAKDFRRLNRLTMKGLDKATVHCLGSILVLMAWALAALLLGHDDIIRCAVSHLLTQTPLNPQ